MLLPSALPNFLQKLPPRKKSGSACGYNHTRSDFTKGKYPSIVDWGEHRITTLTPTKNGSEQGVCETARENTRLIYTLRCFKGECQTYTRRVITAEKKGQVPSYALNYGTTLLRERARLCGCIGDFALRHSCKPTSHDFMIEMQHLEGENLGSGATGNNALHLTLSRASTHTLQTI